MAVNITFVPVQIGLAGDCDIDTDAVTFAPGEMVTDGDGAELHPDCNSVTVKVLGNCACVTLMDCALGHTAAGTEVH